MLEKSLHINTQPTIYDKLQEFATVKFNKSVIMNTILNIVCNS